MTERTDHKGDPLPACGWRQSSARNRVDGAVAAVDGAIGSLLRVIMDVAQDLPVDTVARLQGLTAEALDSVQQVQHELRTQRQKGL